MKMRLLILSCLMLVPAAVLGDDAGTATIVTGARKAVQCISPIEVYKIDGIETIVPELVFEIPAGRHTIQGRAKINTTHCKTVGRSFNRHQAAPLEADFEAGKTYYVGYDHSASNARDWKIVIFRVDGES